MIEFVKDREIVSEGGVKDCGAKDSGIVNKFGPRRRAAKKNRR